MANNLPRFLLRNCMAYINRTSFIGQIGDVTPPVPTRKREDMRNAGMIKPRKIDMGYEALEFSFKMPGFDPAALSLFGLKIGEETPFLITGAHVSEDGTTHSAVMDIRGRIFSGNPGTWTPGERADNDYGVDVDYYKLEIDGEEIYEMDDFDFKVRGVSLFADIRNALLL